MFVVLGSCILAKIGNGFFDGFGARLVLSCPSFGFDGITTGLHKSRAHPLKNILTLIFYNHSNQLIFSAPFEESLIPELSQQFFFFSLNIRFQTLVFYVHETSAVNSEFKMADRIAVLKQKFALYSFISFPVLT